MAAVRARVPRVTYFGVEMPHIVVDPGYGRYKSDFLQILSDALEDEGIDPNGYMPEFAYVRDNVQFIVAELLCFADHVQEIELPELICVPSMYIGIDTQRTILVPMYHYIRPSTGQIDCHFFGFKFADDLALRGLLPDRGCVFVKPGTLNSVYQLLSMLRGRMLRVEPDCGIRSASDATSQPTVAGILAADPQTLRESVDVVLASNIPQGGETEVPGPFIFCSLSACSTGKLAGAVVFKEQIIARAHARIAYYKYSRGQSAAAKRSVRNRIDCGVFSSAVANDLYHEMAVVLVLIVVFKRSMEFFMENELRLMHERIRSKLLDKEMRVAFIEANGMLEAYTAHQQTCTHEKYECFEAYAIETYKDTLLRLARITDYMMHDMPTAESRQSDAATIGLLESCVGRVVSFLKDKL